MEENKNKKHQTTYKSGIQQEYVDQETGELIRQYVVTEVVPNYVDVKLPKKHTFNNGDFITIFQNTMYNIATKANLSKGELNLLLFLLGTSGLDNSICVDFDYLCEELREKKPNMHRYLKGLVNRNIVIRKDGYRGGNQKTLPMELRLNYDQLNYDLAFKGKIKEYKVVKNNHPVIATSPAMIEEKQMSLFDEIE